jgi:hypothetical protein
MKVKFFIFNLTPFPAFSQGGRRWKPPNLRDAKEVKFK